MKVLFAIVAAIHNPDFSFVMAALRKSVAIPIHGYTEQRPMV